MMKFMISVIPALHAADGRQRHPLLCQTPVAFLAVVWALAQSAAAQPQWRNGEGENVSPRLADGREAPGVLAPGDAAGRPQTRDFSAPEMPAAAPNDEPAAAQDSALDVTRFGARPDDGEDDTDAFLAAFRKAQSAS